MSVPIFDTRDPAIRADPFALLARLREEQPVQWSDPAGGWILSRYADVRRAATEPGFSADRVRPFFRALPPPDRERWPGLEKYIGDWAVFFDPPFHTRLRGQLNRAFTSRAVAALRPKVEALAEELIDRAIDRGGMDFIRDFAYPIPASVIMLLLGVPREALEQVKAWSDDMALFVGTSRATADKYDRAESGMREMAEFFTELVRERRRRPEPDLISAMATSDAEDRLGEDELVASCSLLLFAGHETTTNLLGNGIRALLLHRDQYRRLEAEPALTESAVEEMLRWDGPTLGIVRIVAADAEVAGVTLEKGQRVFAMAPGANRDPAAFPEPDRFDVARAPNRHLTFGAGIHFCLGAPLARLEAQIAVSALMRRLADMTLEEAELDWLDSLVFRGVTSLPVSFRRRR